MRPLRILNIVSDSTHEEAAGRQSVCGVDLNCIACGVGSASLLVWSCRALRGISSLYWESTARMSHLSITVESDAGGVVSANQCIVLPIATAFRRYVQVEVAGWLSHVSHVKKRLLGLLGLFRYVGGTVEVAFGLKCCGLK